MGQERPGKRLKGLDIGGAKQVLDFGKPGLGFWKTRSRILDRKASNFGCKLGLGFWKLAYREGESY